ncbi:MAG: AAA family ATPase, partial [Firmicutes bacterium]|nr:AAA family ATPase [Bacillota bacterium]
MSEITNKHEMTPRQVVAELDKYIVGQEEAKRCVAVVLRNRYRRMQLPEAMREEIVPKNIIMIGSTGVGKTEIARRLAKLVDAPFIKVEATKFTEVGYVGRDVESIVRDLVETSIRMVRNEKMEEMQEKGKSAAELRLLDMLAPLPRRNRFLHSDSVSSEEKEAEKRRDEELRGKRVALRAKLEAGELDREIIEIEVEDKAPVSMGMEGSGMEEMGINMQG